VEVCHRLWNEESRSDEFGQAQGWQFECMGVGGQPQQQVGDHRGDDLQLNGVLVVAEEPAQLKMLLDPAKQQLDLPTGLVEGSDLDRRAKISASR
jgi:hypothetical protein